MAALEIQNVTLKFGGLIALNGVTFNLSEGELCALVGPNGAGKTALLNCISGVYRPTAGAIVARGVKVSSLRIQKIAASGIGRSFQHAELFPHMTVTENLLVGRHLLMHTGVLSGAFYYGQAKREEEEHRRAVENVIDFFELYRYRETKIAALPYGVQKLVGVARALASEPKLLLLDEPSTGLMREERENFARFLLRMRHDLALTILWVEHDMQMVADLADRIVVLNSGELLADGPPNEVCSNQAVIAAYLGL